MQNASDHLNQSLEGRTGAAWLSAVEDIADEAGYFQPLSAKHNAAFIDAGKTLLVTFETLQSVQSLSQAAHPVGWDMVREEGWSHLGLFSNGLTWFRDPAVFRYFDRLIDDGFFEDFDQVLFYGSGSCGYAACAFSVAAPGAQVLALSPQATLDPRVSEWDERFKRMRRVNFTERYGYAPDMLDAADRATLIYDPRVEMDAMHAALFTRPNVSKLRMPYYGAHLDVQMTRLDLLTPLLVEMADGADMAVSFARLHRERRTDRTYLRAIASELEDSERWSMAARVYRYASQELNAPRFRRRLGQIEELIARKATEAQEAAQAQQASDSTDAPRDPDAPDIPPSAR